MRQNCIDTIETNTAPLPSWGQWVKAGARMVKADAYALVMWAIGESGRQRHRRHLRELSDETLRDVGLTRADIEQEIKKDRWVRQEEPSNGTGYFKYPR